MRFHGGLFVGLAVCAVTTAAAAGCRQATPPPPPAPLAPVVDIKRLMSGMVDPSADIVWQSVAVTIDRAGEHHTRPATNDEWLVVQNHAMIVAESANLLMIAPRAKDDGEWMRMSRAMREAAGKAYEASLKQDPEALLTIGGEIYDACAACHKKYLPPGEEDPI
jgi:hypothetical protein